jgi:hypothetical protein
MTITLFENSYVSVAEADAYLSPVSTLWNSATLEEQERFLIVASRELDALPWLGTSVSDTQPMAWPRQDVVYHDRKLGRIIMVPDGTLPRPVKEALFNQVQHLMAYPQLVTMSQQQDFESIKVGPIEIVDSDSNTVRSVPRIPTRSVHSLIKDFLSQGSSNVYWRAG